MKYRKYIFYSGLFVFAALWIAVITSNWFGDWFFETTQDHNHNKATVISFTPPGRWAKELKKPWVDTKVVLYRPTGEVIQLDAKQAVYTVWSTRLSTNQHKGFDSPVAAFIDPMTRNVWIGEVASGNIETNEYDYFTNSVTFYLANTNFFIETTSGIIRGDTEINDGSFNWSESPVQKLQAGQTLDSVIYDWNQKSDGSWPLARAYWTTRITDYFPENFFSSGNMGSQTIPIQHIKASRGLLRLDTYSFEYRTKGSVWLDLKTLRVRGTVEYAPVRFGVKTLYQGILPALGAILAIVWSWLMMRKSRRPIHYVLGVTVVIVEARAMVMLYSMYVLGAWPTYIPFLHPVFTLGSWAMYWPIIIISGGFLIAATQAAFLRIINRYEP